MFIFSKTLSLFLLLLTAASVSANQIQLVGKAVDQKSGEFLYNEVHTFIKDDNSQRMTTSYVAQDQSEIAFRTVEFVNDRVTSYVLNLNNIDHEESVVRNNQGLEFHVDKPGVSKVEKQINLKDTDSVIIDAGFNNFLFRNWDTLLTGKTLQFDFANTAQLDIVKLQLSLDKKRSTNEQVIFTMTAANMFLRMLVKPIKVGFYRESRQLAYYSGVSNLKNDDGDAFDVQITFTNGQTPHFRN